LKTITRKNVVRSRRRIDWSKKPQEGATKGERKTISSNGLGRKARSRRGIPKQTIHLLQNGKKDGSEEKISSCSTKEAGDEALRQIWSRCGLEKEAGQGEFRTSTLCVRPTIAGIFKKRGAFARIDDECQSLGIIGGKRSQKGKAQQGNKNLLVGGTFHREKNRGQRGLVAFWASNLE